MDICEICGETLLVSSGHVNAHGPAICATCAHDARYYLQDDEYGDAGMFHDFGMYCECSQCAGTPAPTLPRNRSRLSAATLAIAAALFTLTIQAPADCTITGTTGPDEGFPVATCDDGTILYADMDGNGMAGLSYRAPGTWVEVQ